MFGNNITNYLPTSGNWSTGHKLIVQGADFSSIGFHDAGSRVDFIVGGGGILRLGYDGGLGCCCCDNARGSASGRRLVCTSAALARRHPI